MTILVWTNNANSTLASGISSSATTLSVAPGDGAKFPSPSGSQAFLITLVSAADATINEICLCTSRTGDVLTITRGQESTTPLNWNTGDFVNIFFTAGTMQNLGQNQQVQANIFNSSATDTGSGANHYVVTLSPPLTAAVPGMPIWFKAAHTNTGTSDFNPGPGVLPLINPSGSNLSSGQIHANGWYCAMADGAGNYMLVSSSS